MIQMNKRYSELRHLKTFEERFQYLKLNGVVGMDTFGHDRYLNQVLYQRSREWKQLRNEIIVRDNGCDLGIEDIPINGKIIVHHLNPLTPDDIVNRSEIIFDPENLICVSLETHNALHYGDDSIIKNRQLVERYPNDTIPWRL